MMISKRIANSDLILITSGLIVGYFIMSSMSASSDYDSESGDYASFIKKINNSYALVTISTCSYCNQARTFLNNKKLSYTELIVDESLADKQLFLEYFDVAPVPILISKDKMLIGFNKQKWNTVLDIRIPVEAMPRP